VVVVVVVVKVPMPTAGVAVAAKNSQVHRMPVSVIVENKGLWEVLVRTIHSQLPETMFLRGAAMTTNTLIRVIMLAQWVPSFQEFPIILLLLLLLPLAAQSPSMPSPQGSLPLWWLQLWRP